jgi:hypothetical protein
MASNTIPFQPAYSLNPKYGFRYGPSSFVDTTTKVGGNPVSGLDLNSSGVPPLNNPTVTSGNSTIDGGDTDNGSAQAGIDMSTQASIAADGKQADTDPRQIPFGLASMVIPVGAFAPEPRAGFKGSKGTIGPNGGMFNAAGREIDQISGRAYNSYGSGSQFYNGSYMSGVKDSVSNIGKPGNDLFGAVFSDPDNAFEYDRSANALPQHMQFAEAKRPTTDLEATAYDDLNLGMSQAQKNANATKQGFNMGIPAHSMENNSATHDALAGIGYSSTGAATPGSQYSKTGTFSTSSSPTNVDSGSNNEASSNNNNDGFGDMSGMDFNAGGLVPPPNMGKRAQDVPNPMMQDPLAGLL